MREKLRRADAGLAAVEGGLLTALLAVMVALAFAQVVLRQFGAGLLWAEIALKQLVLWTGFLGAALAAHHEKNFAWEAAHLGAPERWRPLLRAAAGLATAVVCGFLLGAAWKYAADERAAGSELFALAGVSVPAWLGAAAIPAGFLLILVHSLLKAADAAAEAAGR